MSPLAREALRSGLAAGRRTVLFLAKTLIPVSLATNAVAALGWLAPVADAIAPAMALFGLPGEAALALLSGGLLNIYAALGVLAVVPLDAKQINTLAIMILVGHNLVVETAVQRKLGMPAWAMLSVRLSTAVALGLLCRLVIPEGEASASTPPISAETTAAVWPGSKPLSAAGADFAAGLLGLAQMLAIVATIVFPIMIAAAFVRAYGWMSLLARPVAPFLWGAGLSRDAAFMTTSGLVFGLAYGAGVILEDARSGRLSRRDLVGVNVLLGTSHALIEDTLLFVAVGASAWWILLLRVVFCVPMVRLWQVVLGRMPVRAPT